MTTPYNPGPHGKLYDIAGAAALTGYSKSNVHSAVAQGKFPAPAVVYNKSLDYRQGSLWQEEDILAWAGLTREQKGRGEGTNVPGVARIEDYATGEESGLIVCTITGGAGGFLSAAKSVEYSVGGLTREEAAEVALKAAQGASRGEA